MSLPPDPNWPRWIEASIATHMEDQLLNLWNANDFGMPVKMLYDGIEERTDEFMKHPYRVELRTNGPNLREQSRGCYLVQMDINILFTLCMESLDNAFIPSLFGGFALRAMNLCIPILRTGCLDPVLDDDSFIDSLTPRPRKNDNVKLINFAQLTETDEVVQKTVDGQYEMTLQVGE